MNVYYFDLEDMALIHRGKDHAPREGETVVLKFNGRPPVTAYQEYGVREVVHALHHGGGCDVFVTCVRQRDAKRASARMHQLLEAIK